VRRPDFSAAAQRGSVVLRFPMPPKQGMAKTDFRL